jgi:hypothetical protein
MRYRAKTDVRQPEIVRDVRKMGASVLVTSGLGKGAPDFIVGCRGRNYMFELKSTGNTSHRKKGQLTPDQVDWHASWQGHILVIETTEEVLAEIADPPSKSQYMSVPKDSDLPF